MPSWYPHGSWEHFGVDCVSLLAWQWISNNTQRCPNRTVLVKSALGMSVGPCQGRETPWQFCIQRTQSVSLSAFSSVIPRIVLKVSNSCIHPFLPANRKNTCLPLCFSWSNQFSAQLSAHNLSVIEEFLVSPQLFVPLLFLISLFAGALFSPQFHWLWWNASLSAPMAMESSHAETNNECTLTGFPDKLNYYHEAKTKKVTLKEQH